MPLSFKDNIRNAALRNTALGKSLINQPLIQYLLDHLLGRNFSFISQSLVRSFSKKKAIEYYPILTPYCPLNLISLVLICIQTTTSTVLLSILTRTWANTSTALNLNQLLVLYYYLN